MDRPSQKTCVIAGASTPPGLAFARWLQAAGWHLVLIEGSPLSLKAVERSLLPEGTSRGSDLLFLRADLRNGKWLKLAARLCRERFGSVDLILVVSDFCRSGDFTRLPLRQFRLHLDHNIFGPAALVHSLLPLCTGDTSVLFLTRERPEKGGVAFGSSMDGLRGLAFALKNEPGVPGKISFLSVDLTVEMSPERAGVLLDRLNQGEFDLS